MTFGIGPVLKSIRPTVVSTFNVLNVFGQGSLVQWIARNLEGLNARVENGVAGTQLLRHLLA